MKLSIIEIENFRGIADSGKIFLNEFLLLVGMNNSGKSTILRALDLFFNDSFFDCGKDYPVNKIGKTGFKPSTKIRITFEKENSDKLGHQLSAYFIERKILGVKKQILTIEIEYSRNYNETKVRNIKINNKYRGKDRGDEKYHKIFNLLKQKISYAYIPAHRVEEKTGESKFISDLIISVLQKSRKYKKSFKGYIDSTKQQLGSLESQILKSINGFPTVKKINFDFVNVEFDPIKAGVKLFVTDKNKTLLEHQGSGFQSALVIAVIKILSGITKAEKCNLVFGIEEPENFLHPPAQRALIDFIKNHQSLISTHSPIILNELSPRDFCNILKCNNDADINFFQLSSATDIKILTQLYEVSDIVGGEFFFGDQAILVEGISDLKIIKTQLRKNNYYSAIVIPVGGNTNFNGPIKLLRSFKAKILLIVDEDCFTGTNKERFKNALIDNQIVSPEKWIVFSKYVIENINKESGVNKIFIKSKKLLDISGLIVIPREIEAALIDDSNVDTIIEWLLSYGKNRFNLKQTTIDAIEAAKIASSKVEKMKEAIVTDDIKKRYITEQLFDLLLKKNLVPVIFQEIAKLVKGLR